MLRLSPLSPLPFSSPRTLALFLNLFANLGKFLPPPFDFRRFLVVGAQTLLHLRAIKLRRVRRLSPHRPSSRSLFPRVWYRAAFACLFFFPFGALTSARCNICASSSGASLSSAYTCRETEEKRREVFLFFCSVGRRDVAVVNDDDAQGEGALTKLPTII